MTLTNAHTHLELSDLAHLCPAGSQPFLTWLRRLAWALIWRREDSVRTAIETGIAALRACGTTHVGEVTATWLSVGPLLGSGLDGVVYLEVAGLQRRRALARLAQAKLRILQIRSRRADRSMQVGLSLHAPYSCHPDLLREGAAWCRAERVPLCIHVAESPAELEWMQDGTLSQLSTGEQLLARGLGLRPSRAPMLRPVSYLASLGVLDARPLLIHAVHVTDDEVRQIADTGCAVAHCPRSNERLSNGRMPLDRFLSAGVRVCLGTDSLASSPSLDVRDEAAAATRVHAGCVAPDRIESMLHQGL